MPRFISTPCEINLPPRARLAQRLARRPRQLTPAYHGRPEEVQESWKALLVFVFASAQIKDIIRRDGETPGEGGRDTP